MCGILAAFFVKGDAETNRRRLLRLSKLLRHRGPDASGLYQNGAGNVFLCHERLNVVDASDAGRQPFLMSRQEGDIAWVLNSELYNHKQLKLKHLSGQKFPTSSDSYVPGALYAKYGGELTNEMIDELDGVFATVIYDEKNNTFMAMRDAMGISPMYWGKGADGSVWFASEMKAIQDVCVEFEIFPPGHVYRSKTDKLERWFNPSWLDMSLIPSKAPNMTHIRETFIKAVVKRLMSDAPLGVLLSGGLDSSLVASVAVRHLQEQEDAYDRKSRLHTFSIGIKGSPDLRAARRVAEFLGTEHHEFHFTVLDGIDALPDLIWHIESFEQVRAAVPMYLLARKIRALGIKVVLSGEGADELYGGYLYFHHAPSAEEFHRETIRKTTRLHQWDVMRANKAPFAWGLEPRVPFLDKDFMVASMEVNPAEKMCRRHEKPDGRHPRMEKYLLRKAFDTPDAPYLPEDVLWRQKEQFSDGVGYDWVDSLKAYADQVITDELWEQRAVRFPEHTPTNKEYYLLRSLFEEQFPSRSALATVPQGRSIACSTPEAVAWHPEWQHVHDISGRAIAGVHDSADGFTAACAAAPAASENGMANGLHGNGAIAGMTVLEHKQQNGHAGQHPLQAVC